MEEESTKHAVVVEGESGGWGVKEEVVVFGGGVVGREDEESAGHAEVEFEVEGGLESKEETFSVSAG